MISNMPAEEAQKKKVFYDSIAKVLDGDYNIIIKPAQMKSSCGYVEDPNYPFEEYKALVIVSNNKNKSDFYNTAKEIKTFAEIVNFLVLLLKYRNSNFSVHE